MRETLNGSSIRSSKDEANTPSIGRKIWGVVYSHWSTTQLPTATQLQAIDQAEKELSMFADKATRYFADLASFEKALEEAGAPYTPGRH